MTTPHSRASVLVVNADIAMLKQIGDALSSDYDVFVAKSAAEGLQQALNAKPDLILLDVDLPGTDGFALCRQLKSDDTLQNIPVIFVSGPDKAKQIAQGLELGAADYIIWPVEIPVLRARVNTHVRLYKQSRQLESLIATDSLTGLANRKTFEDALAREIARNHREQHALSLLITDIDNFNAYNEQYGHGRGNDCLTAIARLLGDCARRETDLVSRPGGDTFAIILSDTDACGAEAIANNVNRHIASANIIHVASDAGCVSVSTAVVCVDFAALAAGLPDTRMLVDSAACALYDAKAQGQGSIVVQHWP